MADISIKKVFIDYVSRFEDSERGFSQLQRDTRSLKRDTDAYSKSFDGVVKSLRSAAKAKKVQVFDVDGIDEFLDGIKEIEAAAQKMGPTWRAAFNIDPRVRRAAKEQLANIQDYKKELGFAAQQLRTLQSRTRELAAEEDRLKVARDAGDKSSQFAAAHRIVALRDEIQALGLNEDQQRSMIDTMARASTEIRRGSTAMDSAAKSSASFGDRINRFTARLRQVFPVMRGLAIIIVTALVPGIIAFAGGVINAAGALGGLATAAAAAAGPALLVLTGFFSRLSAVMKAYQAQQAATTKSHIDEASASNVEKRALEALHDSQQRAASAARSVAEAERSLRDAQTTATDAIEQATQRRKDAWREVQEAAREVAQTEIEGLRAIKDAAEEASDAIRDVARAKLSLEEAKLDTRDAVLQLKELREGAEGIGPAFDTAFKKFTDVAFEFDPKALQRIFKDSGIEEGSQDAIDIERAILRVRQARLHERDAVDQVGDSERDLNDKRKEANKLQREETAGFQPHIDAVQRLDEAQRNLAEATEESNRLALDGVRNNPIVISARQALAEANRQQVESEKDLKQQMEETKEAQDGMTPSMKRYEELRKQLSASEAGFLDQLLDTKSGFVQLVRAGSDPIFDSLSRVLQRFRDLKSTFAGGLGLQLVQAQLRGIGDAIGKGIENLAEFATSARGLDFFSTAASGARQLINILGGDALKGFLNLFANLTDAFMPHLVRLTQEFADTLGRASKATQGIGSKDSSITTLVGSLESIIDLVGSVTSALFAFGQAAGPAFQDLAKFIKEGFDAFTKWASSAEGRDDLKKFFKDTIPFAKAVLKFIVKLGSLFLKIFQFLAPALTDFFTALDQILDILHVVVDALNSMPTIFKRIIGAFIPLALALRGGMFAATVAIRGVTLTLGAITTALTLLGGLARDALMGLLHAFQWIVKKIMDFLGIGSPSKLFIDIGKDILRGLAKGVDALKDFVARSFKKVMKAAIKAVDDAFDGAVELGGKLIRKIVRGAVDLATSIFNLGKRIINWLADGILSVVHWAVNAVRNVWEAVTSFFGRAFTRIFNIGKKIVSELAAGIASAAGEAVAAITSLLDDIIDVAHKVLGIKSPSRVFYNIGKQTVRGFAKGIKDNTSQAAHMVDKMFRDLPDGATFSFESRQWLKSKQLRDWFKDSSVNRDNLPNTIAARKYGIQEIQGRGIAFPGKDLILDGIRAIVPGLATGGIVSSDTLARIGEAGKEAVIPLNRAVLRQLGQAIVGSMSMPGASFAGAGSPSAGRGSMVIEHQEVHLPAPPAGGVFDPRYASVLFAKEIKRRGF